MPYFPYMVILGNRGVQFGTIFPYMVIVEIGAYGLVPSHNTVDVALLFELVLYRSCV